MDANLTGANLGGAKLMDANLTGANLMDANLTGANLGGTDLKGGNLTGANLKAVNLYGVNLYGADLRGAKSLSCNQVNSVKSLDKETKFPDYFEVKITGENQWTCKELKEEIDKQEGELNSKAKQETERVVR